jgi:hypothetical protein
MTRVEFVVVLDLDGDPPLDDGTLAVGLEEALEGAPIVVGGMRAVVPVDHAEVVEVREPTE